MTFYPSPTKGGIISSMSGRASVFRFRTFSRKPLAVFFYIVYTQQLGGVDVPSGAYDR